MTIDKALDAFKRLYSDIDKDNHLFIGTINPDMIEVAIRVIEHIEATKVRLRKKIEDCGDPSVPGYYSETNQQKIAAYAIALEYLEELE